MALPPKQGPEELLPNETPNNNHNKNQPEKLIPEFDYEKYISADDIKDEVAKLQKEALEREQHKGLFIVKSANQWMNEAKLRPIPRMLFSEFWYEGELCILFADTNLGKSILAVQLADSISRAERIPGFKIETEAQKVLYFDFELNAKQFENRYSKEFAFHYVFNNNFIRIEINPDVDLPENCTFELFLGLSIERAIEETGARILLVDNLTYLRHETEKAKDALPLMKELKVLKNKFELSLLALAHTPKRDLSKPLTRNDLQGSKMLINFCDSAFAIGESSHDKSVRYIKQIKARNCEHIYDAENVCVCQINKPDNFLQFEFLNFGRESEHLKAVSDDERSELEKRVKELLEADPTLSGYAIAQRLCPDPNGFKSFHVKINRIIKRIGNT